MTRKKVIFVLFFGSGTSGLIYEVVWLRMLSRITGVTTYATTITVAAFMAGLALGSFIFGRFIDKRGDPLKIYALLQLSIASIAIFIPLIFKISIWLYKHIFEISNQNLNLIAMVRVLVSFVSLLIPTTLMGATLPVLSSYIVRNEGSFGKNLSLLYGINTLGAVFGVVLSGFITIGAFGEWNTILLGVLINFIVGSISFYLYRKTSILTLKTKSTRDKFVATTDATVSVYPDIVRKIVLVSILISGFTALAYEVIWTRQLILFLLSSIYSFSAMLAVFLTGVGLGSLFINKFVDRFKTPLIVFGILELLVGLLSILSLYSLSPLSNSLLSMERSLFSRVFAPIILVFPLALLFGAIFPVASLCYVKSIDRTGSSVGIFYSFNTMGNIGGAFLTCFLLMNLLGSGKTIILLGFINVAIGLVLLYSEPKKSIGFKLNCLLIIPVVIFLSLGFEGKDPFLNIIEKRISNGRKNYEIFYHQETVEGTITSYVKENSKALLINGYTQTTLITETKLMAHLPIMLAKNPKKLLVICFGMGTTVRSANIYNDLNITSVELVPEIYKCFKYYHDDAETILRRKNISFIVADGRNFLLLSSAKYDIITVDPSPPIYNAGTVNLYTREFLSMCREHLTHGGIMCLWFPGGMEEDYKALLKTFYTVFPNMTVWQGPNQWGSYIIGSPNPISIDRAKIEKAFDNPKLLKDLGEYDSSCITDSQLLNLLALKKDDIEDVTRDAPIITDNFPYTEFPLWRTLSHRYKRWKQLKRGLIE